MVLALYGSLYGIGTPGYTKRHNKSDGKDATKSIYEIWRVGVKISLKILEQFARQLN